VPAGALTVVPLHDGELVETVPAEPHDRPVRAVVTPTDGLRTLDAAPGGAVGVAPEGAAGVAPRTSAGRIRGR
jgi:5-formyltetrahydrofolate cyclo-ligase